MDDEAERSTSSKAAGFASAVAGFAFVSFTGVAALAPLVVGLVAFFTLRRRPGQTDLTAGLTAALLAHLGWFILGVLIQPAALGPVGVDILFIGALLAWIGLGSGRAPIFALIAYEGVGLVSNLIALTIHAPASEPFKAVLVHIALRAAIIALGVASLASRKSAAS